MELKLMMKEVWIPSLTLLLLAGVTACSPSQSSPSATPSPAPAPAALCVSDFLSASQISESLNEVRLKREDSGPDAPEDVRISLQASALTRAIHARIGLERTRKFIESDLGISWLLQAIRSDFAPNPPDLCKPITQSL